MRGRDRAPVWREPSEESLRPCWRRRRLSKPILSVGNFPVNQLIMNTPCLDPLGRAESELEGESSSRPDFLRLQEVRLMVLKNEKAPASLGHPQRVLETLSLLEMCCLTFWKKQRSPSIYGPYLDVQTHTWSSYLQQTSGLGPRGGRDAAIGLGIVPT